MHGSFISPLLGEGVKYGESVSNNNLFKGINLTKSLMVGDARSDIEAGVKLEMDTMLVLTGKGTRTLDQLSNELTPTFIVENLLVGAELVAL